MGSAAKLVPQREASRERGGQRKTQQREGAREGGRGTNVSGHGCTYLVLLVVDLKH